MSKIKNNKTKEPAFTLVELLVVIAIIGILATLAIVSLQNARARARDAKRIADIKQIQTALELYFNDNGAYPASTSVTSSIRSISRVYMERYPQAPNPPDGDCTEENNEYVYTEAGEDNGSYVLTFCLGGSVASLIAGSKEASPVGIIAGSGGGGEDEEEEIGETWAVCGDNLIDSRDSKSYPTVEIGTQCWIAKNLNIGTRISGSSSQTDNSVIEKYCFSNLDGNCSTSGGLYQWNEMMQYTTSTPNQGICPSGWHIPTGTEWTTLTDYLSANSQYWCGGVSTQIVKSLANTSGWEANGTVCRVGNDQTSNNLTGFTILPAGFFSGGFFFNLCCSAIFWSSSISGADALYFELYDSDAVVTRNSFSQARGNSVRCLKD
ncbi:MAG: FISUMP domain-containing protein [Patescibacteria group bacterium]|jgi:uncharacterized protein (TIGR02145 family)/prepilin-type N-terminal cleavage/methylation domain-containing protein